MKRASICHLFIFFQILPFLTPICTALTLIPVFIGHN